MLIETQTGPLRRILATDSTDASFPSRVPQLSEPGGHRLGPPANSGGAAQNLLIFLPLATSANNGTFSIRLIGWRRIGSNETTWLWIPVILAELACTCCLATGVAGAEIPATQAFVDTIALTTGNSNVSIDILSPANDTIGHFVIDGKGFQKIEATFQITSGPTAMNALFASY